jgi:trans-2,3-dihydro-3-hydroxyanthranilate isomerase
MQAIAKEMNFSETTFVLPADAPDAVARVRIFTPGEELPTAGHPTIGTTFALAHIGAIAKGRERIVLTEGVGPVTVALTWKGASLGFAWMSQATPTFGDPNGDREAVAAALSISPAAITGTSRPVQVVSCGVPFLFVPLTTRRAVDHARVDASALEALLEKTQPRAHGVFIFSAEPGGDRATVYSRMFAPELGVVEDPATGIASGPLGCYLVRHEMVSSEHAGAMLSLQGVRMGRPSHVHIAIGTSGGDITSVRVGGEAVLAGECTLYV